MPGLMTALLNSNWICWVMRISFSVTTMRVFFFGQPGLSPPRTPGRVRAEVVRVGDAVAVVVRIGAAVVVLEAVEVLGLVRALILVVGDAVGVVVEVGAAVVVEVAVDVLGLEDALVASSPGCRRRRCPCPRGPSAGATSTNSRARAAVGGAHGERGLRVGLGLRQVRLGVRELPLVEVDRRRTRAALLPTASSRGAHVIAPFFSASSTVVLEALDAAAQRGPLRRSRSRARAPTRAARSIEPIRSRVHGARFERLLASARSPCWRAPRPLRRGSRRRSSWPRRPRSAPARGAPWRK